MSWLEIYLHMHMTVRVCFLLPPGPYWVRYFPSAQSERKWWEEFLPSGSKAMSQWKLSSLPQLLPFFSRVTLSISLFRKKLNWWLNIHWPILTIAHLQYKKNTWCSSVSMFTFCYCYCYCFCFLPSCAYISYHSLLVESGAQNILLSHNIH